MSTYSSEHLHILGGGQLGQMLALAALPLGVTCSFLDPNREAPARLVGKHTIDDFSAPSIERFTKGANWVTYEFENIPAESLQALSENKGFAPNAGVLEVTQDRAKEKSLFTLLQIPTNRTECASDWTEWQEALEKIGIPAVIKTRKLGYDGKGQARIKTEQDAENKSLLEPLLHADALVEAFVPFDYELSCIGVFGKSESRFYPLVRNFHENGILVSSQPQPNHFLQKKAEEILRKIARHFNYKGVLTVEFFVKDDSLVANEIAPRVHNSGHWTIEGAICSQFENHVRAVMDMPLGSVELTAPAVKMWNIIGTPPSRSQVLKSSASLHLYHKSARPGRKIGHITATGADDKVLKAIEEQLGQKT